MKIPKSRELQQILIAASMRSKVPLTPGRNQSTFFKNEFLRYENIEIESINLSQTGNIVIITAEILHEERTQ